MPAGNSTFKKLAVQWFNDPAHSGLCFVSSSVLVDSFRLRSTAAAAERTPTSSSCNPLTLFTPKTKNIKKTQPFDFAKEQGFLNVVPLGLPMCYFDNS